MHINTQLNKPYKGNVNYLIALADRITIKLNYKIIQNVRAEHLLNRLTFKEVRVKPMHVSYQNNTHCKDIKTLNHTKERHKTL